MAHEILLRAYKHGHDMGGKKNYKIWVSSYSGVLFWRLHFLVSATQFPKSNDTFNVAPWVLTLDI